MSNIFDISYRFSPLKTILKNAQRRRMVTRSPSIKRLELLFGIAAKNTKKFLKPQNLLTRNKAMKIKKIMQISLNEASVAIKGWNLPKTYKYFTRSRHLSNVPISNLNQKLLAKNPRLLLWKMNLRISKKGYRHKGSMPAKIVSYSETSR